MTDTLPTEQEPTTAVIPPIYSKRAIRFFGIFFSTIFAGFMLRQNLLDAGNRKAANQVLLASIIWTAGVIGIMSAFEKAPSMLSLVLNLGGTALLVSVYFEKHFPAENYRYKKIWKPLIIALLITIPLLMLAILGQE